MTFHSLETYIIAVGDGTDTYTYVWEDTNNHHGGDSSTELTPIALLKNFDNDNYGWYRISISNDFWCIITIVCYF